MSPSTVVTGTQIYSVKDGSPLSIEITIGDAQAGGTSMIWEGNIIDIPPNAQPFQLAADGGSVRTKTLHCTTRVNDVNPDTNHTIVTYTLRGGNADQDFSFEATVPNDNDWATYVIDFVFV